MRIKAEKKHWNRWYWKEKVNRTEESYTMERIRKKIRRECEKKLVEGKLEGK